MSKSTRWLLAVAAVEVLGLPLATAHVFVPHGSFLDHSSGGALPEVAGVTVLVLLVLTASLPLVGAWRALQTWRRARAAFVAATRRGVARSLRGVDYTQIPAQHVSLFTAGVWRPRIFVTAGAEARLPSGQLYAALLHERAHARHRDTAWLALVAALERAVLVLPARHVFAAVRLEIERHADHEALRAGARPDDLFEAIVTAAGAPAGGAGLSGAGVTQRLAWLAWLAGEGQESCRAPRGPLGVLLGGFATPPLTAHLLLWVGVVCGT